MSLLSRGRERLDESKRRNAELDEMHHRRDRDQHLSYIRRVLELDPRFDALTLIPATSSLHWECNLWAFDLEGLHFIVGSYWHGNPGESTLLAVKVGKTAKEPEWPPPIRASVSNTRWAPKGYAAIYSLAGLAAAVDTNELAKDQP